ncbi:MAG: AraC family transcriptional regulator, partial [Pseudomonadota bacterium]
AVADEGAMTLGPGDMILVPRGRPHVIADKSGRPAEALETVLQRAGYDGRGVLRLPGNDSEAATRLVCGHFSFRRYADHPVLSALPSHLVVTPEMRRASAWLDDLLRMICQRVTEGELGAAASVRRLSEIVFIEVIRGSVATGGPLGRVLAGFGDPQIGRALELIHAEPQRSWSVESLATEVAMSRSAFADRFRDLVGMSPIRYLSEWRLQKALADLSELGPTIQQVAGQAGYQSAAAFSRAFSARFGVSPLEYRRTLCA